MIIQNIKSNENFNQDDLYPKDTQSDFNVKDISTNQPNRISSENSIQEYNNDPKSFPRDSFESSTGYKNNENNSNNQNNYLTYRNNYPIKYNIYNEQIILKPKIFRSIKDDYNNIKINNKVKDNLNKIITTDMNNNDTQNNKNQTLKNLSYGNSFTIQKSFEENNNNNIFNNNQTLECSNSSCCDCDCHCNCNCNCDSVCGGNCCYYFCESCCLGCAKLCSIY